MHIARRLGLGGRGLGRKTCLLPARQGGIAGGFLQSHAMPLGKTLGGGQRIFPLAGKGTLRRELQKPVKALAFRFCKRRNDPGLPGPRQVTRITRYYPVKKFNDRSMHPPATKLWYIGV